MLLLMMMASLSTHHPPHLSRPLPRPCDIQVAGVLSASEADFLMPKLEKDELAFLPFANYVYGVTQ